MLIVPFKIIEELIRKEYLMKYKVRFNECEKNEKNEVYPV